MQRTIKNDILGRTIEHGDLLLIIKSYGYEWGIYTNKDSIYCNGSERRSFDAWSFYKVDRPNPSELAIKNKLEEELQEKWAPKTKKKVQTIKMKDLVLGGTYKNRQGTYVYLGWGKVRDNYRKTTKEGHVFGYQYYNGSLGHFEAMKNKVLYTDLNKVYDMTKLSTHLKSIMKPKIGWNNQVVQPSDEILELNNKLLD